MKIPNAVRKALLDRVSWVQSSRSPDFVIGSSDSPLLLRWYLLPRNRILNIYLHLVLRSDRDKEFHDHPWWNCSILLDGTYREMMPEEVCDRASGKVIFRKATAMHRLELIDDKPATTLFITGPRIREWGFQCPQGWVHWKEFTKPGSKGEVGRGCGEVLP